MSTTIWPAKLKNPKRVHYRTDPDRSHAEPDGGGDSERDAGKSKKREGLWEPKSEPVPNRTSEIDVEALRCAWCDVSLSDYADIGG